MKKLYMYVLLLMVISQHAISQDTVTLRVIDETKGEVTNSEAWPDESVYTWLGNTSNWAAINNMPAGTMAGSWCGMYDGLTGGKLEKTDEEWIWSFTFEPQKGLTYHWNPGVWKDEARTESHLQALHTPGNIEFSVSSTGVVSGCITLRIKSTTQAIREQETVVSPPIVIVGSHFGILTDNPAITQSWGIDDVGRHFYHWEETLNAVGSEAFMGDNLWAFTSANKGWWGFGTIDNVGLDLNHFKDGYFVFHVKTNATQLFEVGVGSPGKKEGKVRFEPGKDPAGFQRNGQWHRIVTPVKDLVAQGLSLAHVEAPFFSWGEGEVALIAYDEIYFTNADLFASTHTQATASFSVYPNPASSGRFNIALNETPETIAVIDAMGRTLYSTSSLNQVSVAEIDGSHWTKGIYFIRVSSKSGKTEVQKLMVN